MASGGGLGGCYNKQGDRGRGELGLNCSSPGEGAGKISVNTAARTSLQRLLGIGEVLASGIISQPARLKRIRLTESVRNRTRKTAPNK